MSAQTQPIYESELTASVGFDEQKFVELLDDIVQRRAEFQSQRHVSQDIIDRLVELGLYRSLVPKELGGEPISPAAFMELIERLSIADGSVGWVASFAFATKYLCSLPEATLRKVFENGPDVVFAGATYPIQEAKRVEGGVIVNGRWPFGSGCMNASLVAVGISIPDSENPTFRHMAVIPADQIKIDQNWNTIGMTGSGSHTMVVEDVFVADEWVMLRDAPASLNAPEYRYPTITLAAQVLAVCGLGVARAAIDHIVKIALNSKSITGTPALCERENVQIHIAECEAKLELARAWFYEATNKAWDEIKAGREISRQQNMHLRLSSSHAARMGAEVARMCFEMTGTMGIHATNPLSVYLTDAMVTAQHAFLTEGSFMNAGKVMFDHPYIPGYC